VEIADRDARLEYVNHPFEQMTGYARDEALGKRPAELLRSDVHDKAFYDTMWATLVSKRPWTGGLIGRRKDGARVHQVAMVVPVLDKGGDIDHFVAVKQYLPWSTSEAVDPLQGDLREAIVRLSQSEHRYRAMMYAAADAILISDTESGYFVDVNSAACDMFGYTADEFRGLTMPMLRAPGPALESIPEGPESEQSSEPRVRVQHHDGRLLWASIRTSTYDIRGRRQSIAIVRDVSAEVERAEALEQSNKKLQQAWEQLSQSAMHAAIGELAAGVAHEVNNPLQFVESGIGEVAEALERTGDLRGREAIADVKEGFDRIRSITRALLPFSRVEAGETTTFDVNDLVLWACRMCDNDIRHRARLERRLGQLPPFTGHRARIGQLITNLLVNAAQAIDVGHADKNVVTVETSFTDGVISLSVSDTGRGISDAHRARIFEPFFTTKRNGTGLGLAVCHDIASGHRGRIRVTDGAAGGTTFTIVLPLDNGLVAPEAKPQPDSLLPRKSRVLAIDDEPLVLKAYRRILVENWEIVTAQDGDAALTVIASDKDFDVVLCDLMMPTADGPSFYAHVKERAPELLPRIVFCSGGVFSRRVKEFLATVENPVLQKPVDPAKLRKVLRSVARAKAAPD
jgi:PAS domain S-box-containing protein